MRKEKDFRLRVGVLIEYAAPMFVKVKAYKRIRNGKLERVRSYYRRVCGL